MTYQQTAWNIAWNILSNVGWKPYGNEFVTGDVEPNTVPITGKTPDGFLIKWCHFIENAANYMPPLPSITKDEFSQLMAQLGEKLEIPESPPPSRGAAVASGIPAGEITANSQEWQRASTFMDVAYLGEIPEKLSEQFAARFPGKHLPSTYASGPYGLHAVYENGAYMDSAYGMGPYISDVSVSVAIKWATENKATVVMTASAREYPRMPTNGAYVIFNDQAVVVAPGFASEWRLVPPDGFRLVRCP